jgi:subtilisin family serine protease
LNEEKMNISKHLPVFLLIFLMSCGELDQVTGKALHEFDTFAEPNAANFEKWNRLWKKGEWVVTIGDPVFKSPPQAAWKKQVVSHFLTGLGLLPEENLWNQAYGTLNSQIELSFETLGFKTLPGLMSKMTEPTLGFMFVKLPNSENFLKTFGNASVIENLMGRSANKALSVFSWQQDALRSIPGVVWAEPNLVSTLSQARPSFVPAPEFGTTSPMAEIFRRIGADKAYESVYQANQTLSEVNVAVLDTGVDSYHPDLKANIFVNPRETAGDGIDNDGNCHIDDINGIDATVDCSKDPGIDPKPGSADLGGPGKSCPRNPDGKEDELTTNCGHGTHVAGIIAGKHGGNLSTLGVCPSCKIISVRVSERCLQPDTSANGDCVKPVDKFDPKTKWEVDGGIADTSQVRGLSYLFRLRQKDADDKLVTNVINMSLGKYFRSRAMAYVIRNLERLNIVVVAAAGNDNSDVPSYPAAYDSVVSVCATGTEQHRGIYGKAIFSNFGDWVDICAPGVDIYSTVPGLGGDGKGNFGNKSGTSQATPFVAGSIGYLLSVYKDIKSGAAYVKQLKKAANYEKLYTADYNTLYRACYANSDVCDNLLGTGFLDLGAAVQGREQTTVDESNGKAVSRGCVVSSIGNKGPFFPRSAWSSMPILLLSGYVFFSFFRKLTLRQ